jgi:serine/threonine protein kinase
MITDVAGTPTARRRSSISETLIILRKHSQTSALRRPSAALNSSLRSLRVDVDFDDDDDRPDALHGSASSEPVGHVSPRVASLRAIATSSPCPGPFLNASFDASTSSDSVPVIGRGASATVLLAYSDTLGTSVAEKRVRTTTDAGMLAATTELQFAERVFEIAEQHPTPGSFDVWSYIIEIFEARLEPEKNEAVIVMEYARGGAVSQLLSSACGSSRGPRAPPTLNPDVSLLALQLHESPPGDLFIVPSISSEELKSITRDVLMGLHTMHTHLNALHRDIKPGNILLTEDGRAKLADFGLAVVLRQGEVSTTEPTGSYAYMSPERLRGEAHGAKADVWSVGVTVLELACDRHPFLAHDKPLTHDQRFWILATQLGVAPAVEADVTGNPDVLPCVHKAIRRSGLRDDFHFSDFVQRALHPEAAWRASVDELLAHPWLDGVDSA